MWRKVHWLGFSVGNPHIVVLVGKSRPRELCASVDELGSISHTEGIAGKPGQVPQTGVGPGPEVSPSLRVCAPLPRPAARERPSPCEVLGANVGSDGILSRVSRPLPGRRSHCACSCLPTLEELLSLHSFLLAVVCSVRVNSLEETLCRPS